MRIVLPELSLVLLIGSTGSGKSTFASRHFKRTEVLSSDLARAWVSDSENNQAATGDAFEVLHLILEKRLARGRLTVVDATNVRATSRRPLLDLARRYHVQPVAIVLDLPAEVCAERNRLRTDRRLGPEIVDQHLALLDESLGELQREGYWRIYTLCSAQDADHAFVERRALPPNRRFDRGPFDLIGDVHGCADELEELLDLLGYTAGENGMRRHPQRRKAVFLGDLVDRGPRVPDVLRIVMDMVQAGAALCVPGNHDDKLKRFLQGKKTRITHGFQESLDQLAAEPPGFGPRVEEFLRHLPSHYVLDLGKLVVAHAGLPRDMHGRISGAVRSFALYGMTTGELDEHGLPVRLNWAADYHGRADVIYGHTPVRRPQWFHRTINIDTGCVFGGRLTALRYPERELVSVPARQTYAQPGRPFLELEEPPEEAAEEGVQEELSLSAPEPERGLC